MEESVSFKPATDENRRLNMLVWGDSGVGKTILGLQFPSPAVIDLENGTRLYGSSFKFDVLKTTTCEQVEAALNLLSHTKHAYRTLLFDSATVYWKMVQKHWSDLYLKRNLGMKAHKHEFYDLQPKDWSAIKSDFTEKMMRAINLDMNVIVTAGSKPQYADDQFMKKIGDTFDSEKNLPYLFDVIIHLYRNDKGQPTAIAEKDRTNKLPKAPFPCEYKTFEEALGKTPLTRKATPVVVISQANIDIITKYIGELKLTPQAVRAALDNYGVETFNELNEDQAAVIIGNLKAAVEKAKSTKVTEEKK